MPSAKVYTEGGQPYLESVDTKATVAYGTFVSECCEVFQSAIQTMAANPNGNVMSVLGAELLAKLHGPYANALAYEYRLCNEGAEEAQPHITNTVLGASLQ